MAQYIDKAVLAAEIERLKSEALQKKDQCKSKGLSKIMHQIGAYNKVLSFLNTLEGKEVDLEKELKNLIGNVGQCDRKLAKHFFELGMRFSAIGSDYIEGVRGYYETTTK